MRSQSKRRSPDSEPRSVGGRKEASQAAGAVARRAPVLPLHPRRVSPALVSVCLGTVTKWSEVEGILVDYRGSPRGPERATTTIKLSAPDLDALVASGQSVLLTFEEATPRSPGQPEIPGRPILLGLTQPIPSSTPTVGNPRALVDGEVVELRGAERVELRCGEASIVLTKEGKIVMTGAYISSASSGVHRIRGGSVEIN